jgi:hypothetical protein
MRFGVTWSHAAALAAGALLAVGAAAQDPPPAEDLAPELPPQYEVEILVFAHRDFDPTEERFDQSLNGLGSTPLETLREIPVFDESNFDPQGNNARQTPAPNEVPSADPVAEALRVRPLRPEELELGTVYRKLEVLSAYEPLLHAGWVQPGLPEADAQPFDLATLGSVNPRGTVRVHLSRFLHITLDLTLERPVAALDAAAAAPAAEAPLGDGLSEVTLAPRYRLHATRSARSGELHYFDHPAFGVLVRVTPLPTENAGAAGRRPAA